MQLEDIEEDGELRGKTPEKLLAEGHPHKEQRRGSHLLAAAGIDYERRRKKSHQDQSHYLC